MELVGSPPRALLDRCSRMNRNSSWSSPSSHVALDAPVHMHRATVEPKSPGPMHEAPGPQIRQILFSHHNHETAQDSQYCRRLHTYPTTPRMKSKPHLFLACTGVDELSVVVDDTLDETLGLEVGDGAASERSVDLHTVDEGRLRNDAVSGNLLDDTVAEMSTDRSFEDIR